MKATALIAKAMQRKSCGGLVLFCGIAGLVSACALAGILTRPVGALAALWPANAILLGVFVRFPALSRWPGWAGALVGYLLADIATGSDVRVALWLTCANLAGVAAGKLAMSRLSESARYLRSPLSMLFLIGVCVVAGLGAASTGALVGAVAVGRPLLQDYGFWFVTEFVNCLIILPVILTSGMRHPSSPPLRSAIRPGWLRVSAPLFALALAKLLSAWIGGAGIMVFMLPGLIWCAVTFSLFGTAIVTLMACAWLLIGVPLGAIPFGVPMDMTTQTLSFRLGVALLAVAPLTVASLNHGWNELHLRLAQAAEQDALTGVASRGGFYRRAAQQLAQAGGSRAGMSAMMCDVDHFKSINDAHGHAAGDAVLREVARRMSNELGPGVVVGRLGGEEFAWLLPTPDAHIAMSCAERVRKRVAADAFALVGQDPVGVTVSIGVAVDTSPDNLDALLRRADLALYAAKRNGRNRVAMA